MADDEEYDEVEAVVRIPKDEGDSQSVREPEVIYVTEYVKAPRPVVCQNSRVGAKLEFRVR
jgi:hypothetical protein